MQPGRLCCESVYLRMIFTRIMPKAGSNPPIPLNGLFPIAKPSGPPSSVLSTRHLPNMDKLTPGQDEGD